MSTDLLQRHFDKMGAQLKIETIPLRLDWFGSPRDVDYTLDVHERKRNETFILTIREDVQDRFSFQAVDVRPKQRHLLLLARDHETSAKDKFLCGHDERHWFIATIPDAQSVASVQDAMNALRPDEAIRSLQVHGVKPKRRNRRRNRGYIRQGEWFFIPVPDLAPVWNQIHRWEPIMRSGGTPHMVEELVREGGTAVRVNQRYPQGLTEPEYEELVRQNPDVSNWNWRILVRDPKVFARGKVRHPDHVTIKLPTWHRVVMNTESRRPNGVTNVVFLD